MAVTSTTTSGARWLAGATSRLFCLDGRGPRSDHRSVGRLVTTLDVIGLEAFVPEPPRGPGRPPEDRRALARAFVAKAVLGVPTTSALIERLDVDKSLRRILGWERRSQVPSEATFSRAFAEFARGALPDKIHAALIERALGGRIIGAIARDATEIEAREKPVQNTANDGKDDPPAPDNPAPPRKRGRPRKGEQRPRPEPTRLKHPWLVIAKRRCGLGSYHPGRPLQHT